MQQIGRIPRLSPAEQADLCTRAADGDKDALQRLIEGHLLLVVVIAKDYANHGLNVVEILQQGNIGLVRAANALDEVPVGMTFAAFAAVRIRQFLDHRVAGY
jgi:RNA polymerase primary sigma factor